jgi:hypothetical protein
VTFFEQDGVVAETQVMAEERPSSGNLSGRLAPERLTRYYVKRLERLGHKVTLETSVAA